MFSSNRAFKNPSSMDKDAQELSQMGKVPTGTQMPCERVFLQGHSHAQLCTYKYGYTTNKCFGLWRFLCHGSQTSAPRPGPPDSKGRLSPVIFVVAQTRIGTERYASRART